MPPGSQTALADLGAFCRVQAVATPTNDSLINFEVWVPNTATWNKKLVVTGNGGYSPALNYRDMAYALRLVALRASAATRAIRPETPTICHSSLSIGRR